jgi:hypothetical protein
MEDVSFGISVATFTRAHGSGSLVLLEDPR